MAQACSPAHISLDFTPLPQVGLFLTSVNQPHSFLSNREAPDVIVRSGQCEEAVGRGAGPGHSPVSTSSWPSWAWATFAGLQCIREGHAIGGAGQWKVEEGINCHFRDLPLRTPPPHDSHSVSSSGHGREDAVTWRGKEPPHGGRRVPERLCEAEKCPLPGITTC